MNDYFKTQGSIQVRFRTKHYVQLAYLGIFILLKGYLKTLESIHVMLLSHAKWRSFTEMPLPPVGTAGHMLNLSLDSKKAVDQMNQTAAANGGRADVNPLQDLGFMYSRDLADPDGHLWGAFWMDPAAMLGAGQAA